MRAKPLLSIALASLLSLHAASAQTHVLNTATNTFAPSFRDAANADLNGSTYFGWSSGTFDASASDPLNNDEIIDFPPVTLGLGGLDGALRQQHFSPGNLIDILSGSNNIFIGTVGVSETLTLQVPTNGTPGAGGFTTLIIQGFTLAGGPVSALTASPPAFAPINGVSPTFVIGGNANNVGQWFAKYELPGNQASYDVSITLTNNGGQTQPVSIGRLTADSVYSTSSYAPDIAVVPEPATAGLLGLAGVLAAIRRRRARA